jgi:predicted glycoside hydrolase/deacetylase ChbG (UPF0249 family)
MAPNLAERLGYGPEARLLIVNCDDLGVSHAANVAIHRALTDGIATDATLMVPCPWARDAARRLGGLALGVHLTLTCEYPAYSWRGLTHGASLYGGSGDLAATTAAANERLSAADARAECVAQIEAALEWGVDVTHLDVHMDVLQARADLYDVYLDLAEPFRLPVRLYAGEAHARTREQAGDRGILCNDHVIYPWPRRTLDVFREEIPRLRPGVTEIFTHPVTDGDELRAYDPDHANIRAHDAECLLDGSLKALLARHGVRLIGWRELRDLQRGG